MPAPGTASSLSTSSRAGWLLAAPSGDQAVPCGSHQQRAPSTLPGPAAARAGQRVSQDPPDPPLILPGCQLRPPGHGRVRLGLQLSCARAEAPLAPGAPRTAHSYLSQHCRDGHGAAEPRDSSHPLPSICQGTWQSHHYSISLPPEHFSRKRASSN